MLKYVFDTGSITLRENVLTWSIPRFFSLPLYEIYEIRTREFTFKGCNYTLAIWPRGYCLGSENYFGVCLYTNGESRLRDYIEFGIVDDCGITHYCSIQRSESGHYKNDEYLRWAELKLRREFFVPDGCLTMMCKLLSNDLTSSTEDESSDGLCDSREFVFVPPLRKFSVVCPNGDYNCPTLSSHLSSMKLTVPQGYGSLSSSDFNLPFPHAVHSSSCSSSSHKEGKFCKKSIVTESHRCTNIAGDNLKSKGNCRPDGSNPPVRIKTAKNEFKHSRAQSDSKILVRDEKVSDDYLVKTGGKYFPYKKQSKRSCGKQNAIEISQSDNYTKGSENVPSDNFDETALSDMSCNGSCSVPKGAEALQSEDDSKNSSFEHFSGPTPPPSYTAVYCLKNVAELDNHHMNGVLFASCEDPELDNHHMNVVYASCEDPELDNHHMNVVYASCKDPELDNHHMNGDTESCEDPEVSTEDRVDSVNKNVPKIKKAICLTCLNSIQQQPPECENNNDAKDEHSPAITMVHEHLHATEFLPSANKEVIVFVQNENHKRSDAESDIKEEVSMESHNVREIKLDESSALPSSSTDTEKVAAKECLLKAGTEGTTKDIEKRSSLDGLKNLELKMARLLKNMKSLEKLSEHWEKAYLDGRHSDLAIKMGDHTFKVHKIVLESRSPVFKDMLSDNAIEITNNTITINKNICDQETFNDFLLYLYSAKCNMSEANVFGLYRAATDYGVPDLRDECIQYMKNSVGLETVCDIISIAKKHNEAELMEMATAFLVKNVKDILDTDKWKLLMREDPDTAIDLFKRSLGN